MCHSAGAAGAMRKLLWPGFFLLGSLWWSTESHTAVSGHLPAFPPGVRWKKPGTSSSKPRPKTKAAPEPTDAAFIRMTGFTNYPSRGASEWVKCKASRFTAKEFTPVND